MKWVFNFGETCKTRAKIMYVVCPEPELKVGDRGLQRLCTFHLVVGKESRKSRPGYSGVPILPPQLPEGPSYTESSPYV